MLNGNSTALADAGVVLFVDHQHGIAEGASTADPKSVDDGAAKFAKAAQIYGMPIIVSVVGVRGEPELTSRLADAVGNSVPMRRRNRPDSLAEPEIAAAIETTGRKTLLIAGIVTEIAVERVALSALDKGYRPQVVLDACNGKSERSEQAAILRMTQAGVEMTSVPTILGELIRDFSDPQTERAFPLLMS